MDGQKHEKILSQLKTIEGWTIHISELYCASMSAV